MERIKLLHFIAGIDVGGAEQLLLSSLKKIDRSRFDVTVCYLKGTGELQSDFEAAGIRTIFLGDHFSFIPLRALAFLKLLLSERFDILHNHVIHSILIGRIAGWIARVPVIVSTEHNTSNWQKKYFYVAWLYRLTYRIDTKIFAISGAVKQCLLEIGKIPALKVEVVYDGIDIDKFNPDLSSVELKRALDLVGSFPIIGCVGRLDPRKGHKYLFASVAQLLSEYPKIKLVLVGDGKYRKELESEAGRLKITTAVIFAGTQKEVENYLAIFDIFVLPSLHEGLSIALIEAMAMRKPIVATTVGGIPEVVENGKEGILVPAENSQALADAVKSLLNNPEQARQMGVNGRIKAVNMFSLEMITKRVEQIYFSLVRSSLGETE